MKELTKKIAGKPVWVRARLHTVRARGKQCFIVLRQQEFTVQVILCVSENVSKQMVKFASNITKESIIDIEATVSQVTGSVAGCTQQDVELAASQIWVVSAAAPQLPLQIEDASRPEKTDVCWFNNKVTDNNKLITTNI